MEFDRVIKFDSDAKTTQSCLTVAIINSYAANCKNGITGETVVNTFLNKDSTIKDLIDYDGSPNRYKNDSLNDISKALAQEKGLDKYIHVGSKTRNLKLWGGIGVITGLSKNGEKKDSHFVSENNKTGKIDSMDPERPAAKKYSDNSHRSLNWRKLSDE